MGGAQMLGRIAMCTVSRGSPLPDRIGRVLEVACLTPLLTEAMKQLRADSPVRCPEPVGFMEDDTHLSDSPLQWPGAGRQWSLEGTLRREEMDRSRIAGWHG